MAKWNPINTLFAKSGLAKTILLLILTGLFLTSCSKLRSVKNHNNKLPIPKKIETYSHKIEKDEESNKYVEEKGKLAVLNFDEQGRLTSKRAFKSDGTSKNNGWRYEYNKDGNLKTESLYNIQDSIIAQINYIYDNDGKQIEQHRNFYGREKMIFYDYDSDENLSEETLKKSDGTIENVTVFKYDEQGKKIESIGTNSRTNMTIRIEREYNNQNQEVKQIWNYSHGMFTIVYDKQYNKYGSRVLQKKYKVTDSDTTMVEITKEVLKYDDKKNPIYCKTYIDDIPFMVTKSKIEYWD